MAAVTRSSSVPVVMPQTRSPSYRLAFADPEFLTREELRPVRLQLELLTVRAALGAQSVEAVQTVMTHPSTDLLFGH